MNSVVPKILPLQSANLALPKAGEASQCHHQLAIKAAFECSENSDRFLQRVVWSFGWRVHLIENLQLAAPGIHDDQPFDILRMAEQTRGKPSNMTQGSQPKSLGSIL